MKVLYVMAQTVPSGVLDLRLRRPDQQSSHRVISVHDCFFVGKRVLPQGEPVKMKLALTFRRMPYEWGGKDLNVETFFLNGVV